MNGLPYLLKKIYYKYRAILNTLCVIISVWAIIILKVGWVGKKYNLEISNFYKI